MWQIPYMHVIQSDSQFLVVGSQIDTLTSDPSFGHKVCCKYSNGSCEPVLDIYVSRVFHWYNEFFNAMSFDPLNLSLKIQKSFGTATPKMGTHLGVCGLIPSHSPTLQEVWMWLPSCTLGPHLSMPLALMMNPRLRSWQSAPWTFTPTKLFSN
jgi:hypothetical protein